MEGYVSSCASKMLSGYSSPFTATAVSRLLYHAGGVPVALAGMANCDEFAMGSAGVFSAMGPTVNPWSPAMSTDSNTCTSLSSDFVWSPGGSSSGSAAAVASGEADVALGSDTGGSIRQPAALCGVVGLKPTYGAVSRWGLIAFASSLDCPGVFARTVSDCAVAFDRVAGRDQRDDSSARLRPADQDSIHWLDREGVIPKSESKDRLVCFRRALELSDAGILATRRHPSMEGAGGAGQLSDAIGVLLQGNAPADLLQQRPSCAAAVPPTGKCR